MLAKLNKLDLIWTGALVFFFFDHTLVSDAEHLHHLNHSVFYVLKYFLFSRIMRYDFLTSLWVLDLLASVNKFFELCSTEDWCLAFTIDIHLGVSEEDRLTVFRADAQSFEAHFVLGESASFIAEYITNLSQLFGNVGLLDVSQDRSSVSEFRSDHISVVVDVR